MLSWLSCFFVSVWLTMLILSGTFLIHGFVVFLFIKPKQTHSEKWWSMGKFKAKDMKTQTVTWSETAQCPPLSMQLESLITHMLRPDSVKRFNYFCFSPTRCCIRSVFLNFTRYLIRSKISCLQEAGFKNSRLVDCTGKRKCQQQAICSVVLCLGSVDPSPRQSTFTRTRPNRTTGN